MHCNENPIYVFPEKELSGLSSNFYMDVSVTIYILYLPRIGPNIFLQQNSRQIVGIYSQTHECGNWDWGRAIPYLEIFVSNFRYCILQCGHPRYSTLYGPNSVYSSKFIFRGFFIRAVSPIQTRPFGACVIRQRQHNRNVPVRCVFPILNKPN
jgi:hypothetical protein